MKAGPSTYPENTTMQADGWADRGMKGEHFQWETHETVGESSVERVCCGVGLLISAKLTDKKRDGRLC